MTDMDRLEIFRLLAKSPAGLLISSLRLEFWGQTLILDGFYDPDVKEPFQIVFKQCRKISWEKADEAEDLSQNSEADVIAMFVGMNDYQQPASIRAVEFELTIWYKELDIQKSW
jgi:hypothetical protein